MAQVPEDAVAEIRVEHSAPRIVLPPNSRQYRKKNRLRLGSLNVQGGLRQSIAELETYFRQRKLDIFGLSETRLRPDDNIAVKGYKLIHFSNEDGNGGVGFLVALPLYSTITRLRASAPNQGWIKITGTGGNRDLYIGTAYMPQESASLDARTAAWDNLHQSIRAHQTVGEVVLTGDLNA